MEKPFYFLYDGKQRLATVHISLQEDGCFIFTMLKDKEVISRFGEDVDFEIKEDELCLSHEDSHALHSLQSAILDAAKKLPEYQSQKSRLQVGTEKTFTIHARPDSKQTG